MTVAAPPALKGQQDSVQYSQFTAPEIGPGDRVCYGKAGQKEMIAFVGEITGDGSLNLLVLIPGGGSRKFANVLHRDDPRQNDHRLGNNGYWKLPAREAQKREAFAALVKRVEELIDEVTTLKKAAKKSGS